MVVVLIVSMPLCHIPRRRQFDVLALGVSILLRKRRWFGFSGWGAARCDERGKEYMYKPSEGLRFERCRALPAKDAGSPHKPGQSPALHSDGAQRARRRGERCQALPPKSAGGPHTAGQSLALHSDGAQRARRRTGGGGRWG